VSAANYGLLREVLRDIVLIGRVSIISATPDSLSLSSLDSMLSMNAAKSYYGLVLTCAVCSGPGFTLFWM